MDDHIQMCHQLWYPTQFLQVLPVTLSPTCLEALVRIGLATEVDGTFEYEHTYFRPTRHMPPCQRNATCKMSPVTTELFILFASMCNIQIVVCANGTVKNILKYVGKFDQGNDVVASSNTHTGATQIGSQFLHITKIASSAIQEKISHNNSRKKTCPRV